MVEMAQNLEGYICYDEFWLSKENYYSKIAYLFEKESVLSDGL